MALKVNYRYWKHSGGTKDYTFVVVTAEDGKSVIIRNWGKADAVGQFKYEHYEQERYARGNLGRLEKERRGKGYAKSADRNFIANNLGDLVDGLPADWGDRCEWHRFRAMLDGKLPSTDPSADVLAQKRVAQEQQVIEQKRADTYSNWGQW